MPKAGKLPLSLNLETRLMTQDVEQAYGKNMSYTNDVNKRLNVGRCKFPCRFHPRCKWRGVFVHKRGILRGVFKNYS